MEVQGACALVTGAGRGLGCCITEELLHKGATVALHYFSSENAVSEIASRALSLGKRAEAFHADLRVTGQCKALLEHVQQRLGPIDILVNNAANLHRSPPGKIAESSWNDSLDLNLKAVAFLSSFAAQEMVARGHGKIINIGDLAGIEPWPAYLPHAAAKAAVHHLTRCMALAYAPAVQVNAVVPGLIHPPPGWSRRRTTRYLRRIPGGRPATFQEVAKSVMALIENDAITGQIMIVDRGQSLSF